MGKAAEAYIAQIQTRYLAYCYHVNEGIEGRWKPTRFHRWLCNKVQEFIETETENAIDILLLSCPPQHGKAEADDTPVLTRNGWKRHGDLVVGDEVLNHKGEFVKVTHIFPKCEIDREIVFTNGERIKCHRNHEWVLVNRHKYGHPTEVIETKAIKGIDKGENGKRGHRYFYQLPEREPIKGEEKHLEVDPYVLGAWLGDGTNTAGHICSCKDDRVVIDECRKRYPKGREWVHKDTGVITVSLNGIYKGLQKYGMCHSRRTTPKHIPEEYLTASINQRLELLAGLIDTDGYVDHKHNRIVFTTADKDLKDTFIELVATFGWRCSVYEAQPQMSTSGIQGKRAYWQVGFNPTCAIPCRVKRKQIKRFSKQRKIAVKEINAIRPTRGNCIEVEGGIYLCGKTMIPTHNSATITETLPSWYLMKNPTHRVIEVSYNEDFAKRFGRRNREKIERYGEIFGVSLSGATKSVTEWELDNGVGGMISRGVTSGVTGNACNLMIIDDPIKNRQDADSETFRNRLKDEWESSYKSRLGQAKGSKCIVIQTRWHEDDLYGYIAAKEPNVTVINLPCEAEENDLLGRKVGEELCPELHKPGWLTEFKESFLNGKADDNGEAGARAWNALYQGHPTSKEGNMFKREWWKFYDWTPDIVWDDLIMSVDATFKDADTSDYVAIEVLGKKGADMYLVDLIKARLDFPKTIMAIKGMKAKYPRVGAILVEDKANGSAIIAVLRSQIPGIVGVTPKGGKVARASAVSASVESGNWYLPRNANFVGDFIDELASFPNGAHDDLVDAFSQGADRLLYERFVRNELPRKKSFFTVKPERKRLEVGERIHVV